jgi:hypothetical protein
MDTTLSDTMPSAKAPNGPTADRTEHAPRTTRSARGSAASEAAKAPSRAPYTLVDGIKLASGILSVARALGPAVSMLRVVGLMSPLAWVGLARRRGSLATLALFGAGLTVGAGTAILLAPSSGVDLRRTLLKGWKEDIKPTVESVESKVDVTAATARDPLAAAKATTPAPPDHEQAAVPDSEAGEPTRAYGVGYRFG